MIPDLPTPVILIDGSTVRRNLQRLADYAKSHNLNLRPHTKTHKSTTLARLQLDHGAVGLTVAKVGEAQVMSHVADDVLMAYPAVDPRRCGGLARLAQSITIRVAIDSRNAADALSAAAGIAKSTIGILIDLDVGLHRTGVQSPADALDLARLVSKKENLRLDGLFFYPGHVPGPNSPHQQDKLHAVDALVSETLDLFTRAGLATRIVSGGSTPTAYQSHLIRGLTEIRPGTYVFNDMNSVGYGVATLDDCAARVIATVVSTAVPDQVVIDAGSKTLTSDRCGPNPDSGHGYLVEYPGARITKLTEEHGQVDVSKCTRRPNVGNQITIVPNHICPCINLQDRVWWRENEDETFPLIIPIEARGKVV
jgi:D-serine deaminase-like pyridoxal phosphate-dependent protein